jgi:fibronectin-binding autotransporter adhesin
MKRVTHAMRWALAAVLLTLAAGGPALAGDLWDGGSGVNNNWGTATNWNPDGMPANNGTISIHMAGFVRPTPNVDVPWSIASLIFDAGAAPFTVSGSTLTINNPTGVQNMSVNLQTVNAPITLAAPSHFDAFNGDLTIGGAVNNGGYLLTVWGSNDTIISGAITGNGGLTKTESGMLRLSGATANTYAGTTTVNEGTLELAKTFLNGAILGPLVIGDGVGGSYSDVVRVMVNNQIDPSCAVSILNSGLLDLNSFASSIGSLAMTGGAITTGTGTLNLNGHVTGNADASTATISGKVNLQGFLHNFVIANGAPLVDMDVSAALSTGSLGKYGAGTLRFSGTAANTYTGLTTVSDGMLLLGKSSDIMAVAGDLTINSAGTVRLEANQQIADTATVTISGGVMDLADRDETIRSLTMTAGNVTTGAGTLTVTNAVTTNASAITAAVTGNLDLGAVTVSFNIADGTAANDMEIAGTISNGALTKSGAGTLRLSGSTPNTYAGTTTVQAGKLVLAKSTGGAIAGSLVITGGIVEAGANYQISQTIGMSTSISGLGVLSMGTYDNSCRELIMTGGTVLATTGSLQVVGPSITSNASGSTATIAAKLRMNFTEKTFTIADGAALIDMEISGVLADGSLIKAGPGTLRLSGTAVNTYSGMTTVDAGVLELAKTAGTFAFGGGLTINNGTVRLIASNQFTASLGMTINNSGTLDLNGCSQTLSTLHMAGGNVTTGAGTLTLGSGSLTTYASATTANVSGQLDLGGATRTFTVADGGAAYDLDISAVVSNGGITKTGPGTLRLSGAAANTYTGATTVNEGTLELAKAVSVNTIIGSLIIGDGVGGPGADIVRVIASNQTDHSCAVSILNSGLFDLNNLSASIGSLSMTGGAITTGTGTLYLNAYVNNSNADASTATISGKVNMQGMLHQFTIADGAPTVDMDISAVLSSGSLAKEGAGTLRLSGAAANTYTGLTTVSDGTLLLGKAFDILAVAGDLTVSSAGTVRLEADQQIADTAAVAISGGTLDLNGRDETINSLTMTTGSVTTGAGTLTVSNAVTTNASATTAAVTGNLNLGAATVTFNIAEGAADPDMEINGAISNGALTKSGNGTLKFSGAATNTYTGTTTVNAGTLLLDKSGIDNAIAGDLVIGDGTGGAGADVVRYKADFQIAGSAGNIAVNSTGLLDLNGYTDGITNLTLVGGAVATSAGTLTINGLVVTTASASTATISGNLSLGGVEVPFSIADGAAVTDLDISAVVSNGGITKNGAGTLKLSGTAANICADLTTVNTGTLLLGKTAGLNAIAGDLAIGDGVGGYDQDVARLAASNQIPDSALVMLTWGGLLDLAGYSETITHLYMTAGHITTGAGVLTIKGDVTGYLSASTALISGNLYLNNGQRTFFIQDGAAAPDMDVTGAISFGSLQKNGNGSLRFSGAAANTYTGDTTVNQGTLELSKSGGAIAIAGDLTINNGGTVKLTASNQIIDAQTTTINSGGTLDLGSSGDGVGILVLGGGTITGGLASTLNVWAAPAAILDAPGPATISANVNLLEGASGPGTILKTGALTTLTFGDNSDIGGATLEAGTIDTGSAILTIPFGGTYSQTGGIFDGCLWSRGLFSFTGGTFSGRLINEGTASIPAAFTAGDGVLNLSTIPLGAGESITANGAGLDNEGVITLAGGTITGNGPLANNAIFSGYGTIGGSGGFSNSGLVTASGGSLNVTNSGANSNAGNIDLAPGLQLRLLGGGLANTGTINLGGGTVAGTATLTNNGGGTVAGRGTISAPFANAGGTLRPQGGTINVAQPFANSGLVELAGGTGLSGAIMTNSGALQGAGSVANAIVNGGRIEAVGGTLSLGGALINGAAGTLAAGTGGRVFIAGGLATNLGIISLDGGTFDNNAAALVNSGQISGRGTLLTGGLTNNGGIGFSGGISDIYGDVANPAGGRITITGGGLATFYDDVVHNSGAIFQVSPGSSVVFFGLSGTGSFSGTGTVYIEGDLRPGASPGEVSFDGDLVLGGASRLVAELAGTAPGSQYDVLDVGGSLALAGTLDVNLLYGFQPQPGQMFDILDFDPANLSGRFAAFDLPDLGGGLSWDTTNLYTTGAIGVAPEPATLALVGLGALALLRRKLSR